MSLRLAVFASGGGSNLQALLDRLNARSARWGRVALAVSDRAEAGALERARNAGVATAVIPVANRDVTAVCADTLAVLEAHRIDLVALAGYLRLVPADVIGHFQDRIVNIHPALLPAFGGKGMYGMRVHRAVIEAGCRVTGVTVHHVNARYDEGGVIAQWPVPVLREDSAETLAARVLTVEHRLYPLALEWLAARIAGSPAPAAAPSAGVAGFAWAEALPDEAAMRRALGLD